MRELYLVGSILLGAAAVFGTMNVVKYNHNASVDIEDDISYREPDREEAVEPEPPAPKDSEPIHTKNAFDQYRGEPAPTVEEPEEAVQEVPQGNFTFELRGIHILGEKKLALIAATPIRSSRSSRGRSSSSSRPPVSSTSSTQSQLVRIGEEIEGTGHLVDSIEPGLVKIKNNTGITQSLEFDLTSDSSLKRAETAFKNEVSRQKSFAKQNAFQGSKTASTSTTPTVTTSKKTPSVQQRETEMRKRAEQLKDEMRRLKELRDKQDASKKDSSSSKYDKYKKYDKKR